MRFEKVAWVLLFLGGCLLACKEKKKTATVSHIAEKPVMVPDPVVLRRKADQLKQYAAAHGYNTHYAFLADFKVFSGGRRFVCYDLQQHKIISTGLVSHGQGPDVRAEKVVFSNVEGSHCSSLGKYRIGGKYSGRFGTAYKLYGLDSSNSNAFNRFVVLHSYPSVPSVAQLEGIVRSDGCPMLNPAYFATLEPYIDQASHPILLWIYR
ncbi:murein L,D-transpeptidase catalytic domain-containing protein [Chitinophaga sp.]|uniref:murein L,D-transpeptidase catalytic domain-containing protein n=1 Tax=Chitinophaga sp. TaxID=1869181 RepID=UPI0025C16821|nr:murein L,D-transpeptidase catalytic domain family protein [Chitinophaga sp.]